MRKFNIMHICGNRHYIGVYLYEVTKYLSSHRCEQFIFYTRKVIVLLYKGFLHKAFPIKEKWNLTVQISLSGSYDKWPWLSRNPCHWKEDVGQKKQKYWSTLFLYLCNYPKKDFHFPMWLELGLRLRMHKD